MKYDDLVRLFRWARHHGALMSATIWYPSELMNAVYAAYHISLLPDAQVSEFQVRPFISWQCSYHGQFGCIDVNPHSYYLRFQNYLRAPLSFAHFSLCSTLRASCMIDLSNNKWEIIHILVNLHYKRQYPTTTTTALPTVTWTIRQFQFRLELDHRIHENSDKPNYIPLTAMLRFQPCRTPASSALPATLASHHKV